MLIVEANFTLGWTMRNKALDAIDNSKSDHSQTLQYGDRIV